jgi:NhaP-type Na+/H+ or K+/H+ antiporter
VATAFAVAGIAHLLGMPWEAALVLGAAVAPPDATAVAALGRTLPHRNFMLLKAESLTNDGTALVVYAIAVGIAVGGNYTAVEITGLVLLSYVGGMAAGALIAGAAYLVLRGMRDATAINIALLLVPFAGYLLAELIHASGVLAVVVAGLIVAFMSGRISTAASRRQTESVWPLGSYLLNGSLFVLIGLEVQAVAHDLDAGQSGRLLVTVVAVWAGLIVVRFLFQSASVSLIRLLDRRPSQRARRMSYRARVVSTFAGFRGAISLAIALSVPVTVDSGGPFPARDHIIFVTAGVIVLTLLVQGPLLPAVVRWARGSRKIPPLTRNSTWPSARSPRAQSPRSPISPTSTASATRSGSGSPGTTTNICALSKRRNTRRPRGPALRWPRWRPSRRLSTTLTVRISVLRRHFRHGLCASPSIHRLPATRSTPGSGWRCWTANGRCCSSCAMTAPSTTPLPAESRPVWTSKNSGSLKSNRSIDHRERRRGSIPCLRVASRHTSRTTAPHSHTFQHQDR